MGRGRTRQHLRVVQDIQQQEVFLGIQVKRLKEPMSRRAGGVSSSNQQRRVDADTRHSVRTRMWALTGVWLIDG